MKCSNIPKAMVALLAVMWMGQCASADTIIYVDPQAPGANNGSSWTDAYIRLQNALHNARPGDEIRVAQGTYRPDEQTGTTSRVPDDGTVHASGNRDDTFSLPEGVVVRGGYAGYSHANPDKRDVEAFPSTLSGDLNGDDVDLRDLEAQTLFDFVTDPTLSDNSHTVVTATNVSSATVLDGFTITAGHCEKGGATTRTRAEAEEVSISPGADTDGAGVFVSQGSPRFIRCTFHRNTVQSMAGRAASGAGAATRNADATFQECRFEENIAFGNEGLSFGAAVLSWGGGAKLIDCTFKNNTATGSNGSYQGGAIATGQGDSEITGCTFIGNRAIDSEGGAIYSWSFGTTTITGCTFEDNSADLGGAIVNEYAHALNVYQCTFQANQATGAAQADDGSSDRVRTRPSGQSGALYHGEACEIYIQDSRFLGNAAGDRGGAISGIGFLTIVNSAFSGNVATNGGAVSYETTGVMDAINCTFTNNQASGNGGAFYSLEGRADFANCILWGDTPGEIYPASGVTTAFYSIVQEYPWLGTGSIDADPRFHDPLGADGAVGTLDDDLRLSVGSPCLEGGSNASVPSSVTTDLDGLPRVVGEFVDMGAYEFDGPFQYYVDAITGDDSNGGWGPRVAFATIQRGIQAAESGYTVVVLPGVYAEEINFAGKAVTVSGEQGGAILEAPDGYAVSFFTAERSTSVLENFVVRNSEVGIFIAGARPTIRNVTLANNEFGITAYAGANPDISNCILWDNIDGDLFGCTATYSCVQQGDEGEGNIRKDPLFADRENGDFHLLSEKGRFVPAYGLWSFDTQTSPCIDAGNPSLSPGNERMPNGGRINMGAFGGTPEASMSEWPLAADLNRDGRVDFADMAIFSSQWLEELPMADTTDAAPL